MKELQMGVEELLDQLTPERRQQVYEHWIERLQQVRHTHGDHV
jgi:hypothetical protein